MMTNSLQSLLLLMILAATAGCTPTYDSDSCNMLSMNAYKGIPNSQNLLRDHCQDIEIKYTSEVCQRALVSLMVTNSLADTKRKFGDPVEHCFTGDDLKRFAKD